MRRFELHRDVDETGISGTGLVCEGVEFSDGVVALRWVGEWPTTICHYDRGIHSVQHLHGHGGKTRIVFVDDETGRADPAAGRDDEPNPAGWRYDEYEWLLVPARDARPGDLYANNGSITESRPATKDDWQPESGEPTWVLRCGDSFGVTCVPDRPTVIGRRRT